MAIGCRVARREARKPTTIHITPELRIHLQLDILDNLVLGSTPDFGPNRPDVPLVAFSGGQEPPRAGVNGFRDAIAVKEAYGEWRSPLGLLRVGRQISEWGMGVLANGGRHYDADFGDAYRAFIGKYAGERYFIEPEEVGSVVLALCSGMLDAMNGQVIQVDKGIAFADSLMRLLELREELGL